MIPTYEWSLLITIGVILSYIYNANVFNTHLSTPYRRHSNYLCIAILTHTSLQLVRYYSYSYETIDVLLRIIAPVAIITFYLQIKLYKIAANEPSKAIDRVLDYCFALGLICCPFLNGGGLWYNFTLSTSNYIDGAMHTGLKIKFSYFRVYFLILCTVASARFLKIVLKPHDNRMQGAGIAIIGSMIAYAIIVAWNSKAMSVNHHSFTIAGLFGLISVIYLIYIDKIQKNLQDADERKIRSELVVKDNLIDSYLSNTSIAAALTNSAGKVIKTNKTFESLFALDNTANSSLEFLTQLKSIPDYTSAYDFREAFNKAKLGTISKTIVLFSNQLESDCFYEFYFKPNIDNSGLVNSIYIEGHDTTDIIRRNKALDSEKQIQSLGKMAGGISHDFNNILTSIIGITELTKEDLKDTSHVANLDLILKAAYRGTDFTKNLLGFARKSESKYIDFDLALVSNESLRLINRAGAKLVQYSTNFKTTKALIHGDPSEIYSVIMNLLINAGESIKHTGEVALILDQISIKTELQLPYNQNLDEGSYYILTVTDTGAGIKNEDLAHIFTPFYTTKSTGTGFGLSQALSILRAHKGAIQVKTQLGQGTEFSIYLPAIS